MDRNEAVMSDRVDALEVHSNNTASQMMASLTSLGEAYDELSHRVYGLDDDEGLAISKPTRWADLVEEEAEPEVLAPAPAARKRAQKAAESAPKKKGKSYPATPDPRPSTRSTPKKSTK
jgi:hypothetical protein